MPRVTRTLVLLNVAVFLLQLAEPGRLEARFALYPLGPDFRIWQPLSYAFLHGGYTHLFFNMFALYMFGSTLERALGPRRYVSLYFVSVLSAATCQLAVTWIQHSVEPTIGASGGVFGLLLAFAIFFPRERLVLLFPPIPMPAWLFVTGYGVIELFLGATSRQADVAHFAHLGGMLGAFLAIFWWRHGPRTHRPI